MKKRLMAVIASAVMLSSLVPVSASADDADVTISVVPMQTTAYPGSEVTFEIHFQQIGATNTIQMELDIPEGLTYVSGSGALTEGLKETMNFDDISWTDLTIYGTQRLIGVGSISFTGTDEITLASFKCTVDEDAEYGEYEVGLGLLEFADENYELRTHELITGVITVTEEPESQPDSEPDSTVDSEPDSSSDSSTASSSSSSSNSSSSETSSDSSSSNEESSSNTSSSSTASSSSSSSVPSGGAGAGNGNAGGNGGASGKTDNPNTGAGKVIAGAGLIVVAALVVAKKKQ